MLSYATLYRIPNSTNFIIYIYFTKYAMLILDLSSIYMKFLEREFVNQAQNLCKTF